MPKEGTTAGEMEGAAQAVSRRGAEVMDVVGSVASLSSVDGAILLTDDLRVRGFGVEILPSEEVTTVYFAGDDFGQVLTERRADEFGTRHRSAFRFCAKVPAAVAFVVSQDGDTRAVKNVDGRIVVWPHVLANRLSGKPGLLPFVAELAPE